MFFFFLLMFIYFLRVYVHLYLMKYEMSTPLTKRLVKVWDTSAEFVRLFHSTLNSAHIVRVNGTYVQVALVQKPATPLFGREILSLWRTVYTQSGHI